MSKYLRQKRTCTLKSSFSTKCSGIEGTQPPESTESSTKRKGEKYSWIIDGSFRLAMRIGQPSCKADFARFLASCLELVLASYKDYVLMGENCL